MATMTRKTTLNNIFISISIVANIVFVVLFSYIAYKNNYLNKLVNNNRVSNKINHHYVERTDLFKILPDTESEIIFLGSSKTEYCEWGELFQNPRIKNRGIGSDTTKGLLLRMDEIVASNPEKIFIMIGANDLRRNITIPRVIENYEKIISIIKNYSPGTLIYIQSILPVNNDKLNRKGIANNLNLKIKQLNQKLQHLCYSFNIQYIDYWQLLTDNNQLKPSFTIDGIHLSGNAYLQIMTALERHVNGDEKNEK